MPALRSRKLKLGISVFILPIALFCIRKKILFQIQLVQFLGFVKILKIKSVPTLEKGRLYSLVNGPDT